ncbi:mCG1047563, isoform CRA_b, partial [Mus musculus]
THLTSTLTELTTQIRESRLSGKYGKAILHKPQRQEEFLQRDS